MTQASTWRSRPTNAVWNDADNWEPHGVPAQGATFAASSQTVISFTPTSEATVSDIAFAENALAYTFEFGPSTTPALSVTGAGIDNRSGRQQSFIVAATSSGFKDPQLVFRNTASAGGKDVFYCAGPVTEQGYGGGVICFHDKATAGSALFKAWTGAGTPPKHNTVGGEVSFCDASSADNARFMIYGSLGIDGDTFGNVVFHDNATAANATFTNVGGTVSGGDGGNTQFYGNSSASYGEFYNGGGTHDKANGGDVAFDGTANADHGRFHNYAAKAQGAYGGVTSFNNNPPSMPATQGASAGHGMYFNYGAREGEQGGGGHLTFSAKYGTATAANASIVNYGSSIEGKSSAGHTIFSINLPTEYFPTAGDAVIWNHPATCEAGAAGYTEFAVYGDGAADANVPTAGNATIVNLGGYAANAAGGCTVFSGASSAGNARLLAHDGMSGGKGGRIAFYGDATGGTAQVQLYGNGELDLGNHTGAITLGALDLDGGIITMQLGTNVTSLKLSDRLTLSASHVTFSFWKKDDGGFAFDTPYTILSGKGLAAYDADRFRGNRIDGVDPVLKIEGDSLEVIFVRR
ncbi:MAG: hypothetical protein KDJ24_14570 [Gammaproteobacteria bacterium]|nr:hypothetical protein [Gammaproteobacteria bacterium]